MSGFEVAASAAGLISLSLSLFKGCIQAFEFAESAAHLGSDADIVRCKLELEQYRLYQWAEQVGLEDRPSNRLNWSLVANILKQLEGLLTDSKAWKERYHLDVVELGKNALVQEPCATVPRKSGFGLHLASLRLKFSLSSSRIIQEANTSAKKLEWAAIGRDKLHRLADDIRHLNDCLHSLLEVADRKFITAALEALLRDMISGSNVSSELEVVKELLHFTSIASQEAVASAASLKKIRLILGLGVNTTHFSSNSVKLELKYLNPDYLVRDTSFNHPRDGELARYNSDLVLVSWWLVEKKQEARVKGRVEQLAKLLGSHNQQNDRSFCSLNCTGILPKDKSYEAQDDAHAIYGLVFELRTPYVPAPLSPIPAVSSLLELYSGARKPSLNQRLGIALLLAETILQLHTNGWLHKGLRSEHIIFLDVGDCRWENGTARGPYLGGYENARLSREDTETMPERPDWEMYRRPLTQGPSRSNFTRAFDLFALGCVLLEIALWKSLRDVLSQASASAESHSITENPEPWHSRPSESSKWAQIRAAKARLVDNKQGEALASVAFCAGETVKEVILLCLHANDDPEDDNLEVQKVIVEKLRECKC